MPTRVMGLASGMDIDAIIKDLMKAERVPLNKMKQEQTLLEWKRDAFREINAQILNFKNTMFDYTLSKNYRTKYVTSTNATFISAVASNNAIIGSYAIEVKQMATAATLISGKLSTDETIDLSQRIADFLPQDYEWTSGKIHSQQIVVQERTNTVKLSLDEGAQIIDGKMNVFINGKIYEVVTSADNLQEHQVYFNQETGELTFGKELSEKTKITVEFATEAPPEESESFLSFSITNYTKEGKPQTLHFFIKPDETLDGVMKKISQSALGVTMFYDNFNNQMVLTMNETGNLNRNGAEISVSGDFLTDFLKFSEEHGANNIDGKNARFIINGLETERFSNTFEMNGVTFTLKGITEQPVYLQVNHDYDTIMENIKSFVENYNKIVEMIEEKLRETRYRDYLPLTDEEREKLTEKQQEQWEEKARSGLLRHDPILSRFITELRMALSSPVDHPEQNTGFRSLADIGITTTSDYMSAKLEINETKLREAIEKNPDAVARLFNADGNSDNEKGIARRLHSIANATEKEIAEHAGKGMYQNHQFTLGRQLMRIEDDIERFEKRLKMIEDRYYSQFRRMELAIQRANNQSVMLMSIFNPFQSQ